MNADIDDYIETSLKYISINCKRISNKKIPEFSYVTFLDDEKDIMNDYRFRLKEWIINKKNSDEKFIPVIDRIDLNEERKIKAFDQTEDNSQKIFPISNITIKLKKGD
ncbi:MAG: hypothetical protein JSS63_10475 [Bacteroidetes bacterium]|nr:hypothetical protein [Bacteroidota bacterium]